MTDMKNEDFERLKAVCDENGFELLTESPESNDKYFVVKKAKDIWEGVEFGECIGKEHYAFDKGVIYKRVEGTFIDEINCFFYKNGKGSYYGNGPKATRYNFKPSTEQAYIEQLKKEAFEMFGEIKDGDRFDCSDMGKGTCPITFRQGICNFTYIKHDDRLRKGCFDLYENGKWAKRIPERVKVESIRTTRMTRDNGNIRVDFSYDVTNLNFDLKKADEFLAEQLEKYLNGEIK